MTDSVLTLYTFAMDDYRNTNSLLTDARRAFFAAPDELTGRRMTKVIDDDRTTLHYRFRADGLRWRVKQGMRELQRSIKEKGGAYAVRIRRPDGTVRMDHFSPTHQLLRVEYFSGKDLCGIVTLSGDTLDTSFLIPEEQNWLHETLLPCPDVPYGDGESYHRYTRILGLPPAIVYTTGGVLCFYPAALVEKAVQLTAQFAAEAQAAASAPEAADDTSPTEAPEKKVNKKYYAGGKLQKGKRPSEMIRPQSEASAPSPSSEPEEPAANRDVGMFRIRDGAYYTGPLADGLPHGSGVLVGDDGALLYQGEWNAGKRHGTGTEYRSGAVYYTGQWSDDQRHGEGTLRMADGRTVSGQFVHGQLSGAAALRDENGQLLYRGMMEDQVPHGPGTMYRDGQPICEGTFSHGELNGRGKLFENGLLVYAGDLKNGVRNGVGAAIHQGTPQHFGLWENDLPHGFGIRYENGAPLYAGTFARGQLHGRVNRYRDGALHRELVCRYGLAEYMIEYENGHPVYAGTTSGEQRTGSGRLLDKFCRCIGQGVFRDGELMRPTQVIPRRLEALTCPEALRGTPCEEIVSMEDVYILGMPWSNGIYAGCTRHGIPHGDGSIVCADHSFAGTFVSGRPCGEGTLTLASGEVIHGVFATDGAETIDCPSGSYTLAQRLDNGSL